jgi:hypothetical protein
MKRFTNKKRVLAIGLAAGLTLGAAGVAFAYFTSSGSGTGQASTGSATNWGVSAAAVVGGPLYPGQGSQTITYTVTNNGSGNQALNTAVATVNSGTGGAVTQGGVVAAGCLASWYNATAAAPSPAFHTSIIPTGTATVVATVTMSDPGVNQNPCQGIAPDITLTVS